MELFYNIANFIYIYLDKKKIDIIKNKNPKPKLFMNI
jgi:hypothetical protein